MGSVDRRGAMLWMAGAATTLAGCGGSGDDAAPIATVPPVVLTPTPTPSLTPSPTPTPMPAPTAQTNILVTGMSVWLGADLVPPNYPDRENFQLDNAPGQYFRKRLLASSGYTSSHVDYDNQAVGGSFDNDVPAQYAAS